MPQLELSDQEKETLAEVLTSILSELSTEISHTDRQGYRDQIKAQEHMIQSILGKLKQF
ncbi:hypothetical protein [Noviherbaspirillum sp. UKPF54]|uniref:hypothetical protein n=1 Tax=Noviherbaspirillum sp. UKPF54 TaxID=2601898 RepID=UPI00143CDB22|nr:hypothetical protein [Noviherbaspirillum sp. UKPF54]